MRGDPGGEVVCPACGEVRRASGPLATRNGHMSTRSTLRAAIRQHIYSDHPGLSARERTLLVDAATIVQLGGDIICGRGASA